MQRITTPSGGSGYANTLMIAAHLSAGNRPSSRRYLVWMTPTGGAGRGLAESDPRHRAAVAEMLKEGPLSPGGRAEWTDGDGTQWCVREA